MTRFRALVAGFFVLAFSFGPLAAQERPSQPSIETARPLPPAEEVQATEPGRPAAGTPAPTLDAGGPSLPSVDRAHLPKDLSPIGMFMQADWVVKAVMLGLAFASLVTWTVWVAKTLELAAARTKAARSLKALGAARSLADARHALGNRKGAGPIAGFVAAADAEIAYSEDALLPEGVKERVASHLSRLEAQAGRRLAIGTGMLATIGSTAPFVGLFGTVWGIMNSFIGISNAQTTNLAVVAPGIAEALLATAVGLIAAIPAVVIYNLFARQIAAHRATLADASAAVLRIVSRDLDRGLVSPRATRRAAE